MAECSFLGNYPFNCGRINAKNGLLLAYCSTSFISSDRVTCQGVPKDLS